MAIMCIHGGGSSSFILLCPYHQISVQFVDLEIRAPGFEENGAHRLCVGWLVCPNLCEGVKVRTINKLSWMRLRWVAVCLSV